MEHDYKHRITAHDFAIVDGNIYFSALNHNGIYMLSKENKLEFVQEFPWEYSGRRHMYGSVICIDERLFFAPMNSHRFAIYDTRKREDKSFTVDERYIKKSVKSKFYGAAKYHNTVIFIPCRSHYIACMNAETYEIEYHDEWLEVADLPQNFDGMIIKNAWFVYDGYLYLGLLFSDHIIKVSLDDYSQCQKIKIESSINGIADMVLDEDNRAIWILGYKSNVIVRYDLDTQSIEECFFTTEQIIYEKEFPYLSIEQMNGYLYIISNQAVDSYRIGKKTKSVERLYWVNNTKMISEAEWGAFRYDVRKHSDDHFTVFNTGEMLIQQYFDDNSVQTFALEDHYSKLRSIYCTKNVNRETEDYSLSDMLETLAYQGAKERECVGLKIYECKSIHEKG